MYIYIFMFLTIFKSIKWIKNDKNKYDFIAIAEIILISSFIYACILMRDENGKSTNRNLMRTTLISCTSLIIIIVIVILIYQQCITSYIITIPQAYYLYLRAVVAHIKTVDAFCMIHTLHNITFWRHIETNLSNLCSKNP